MASIHARQRDPLLDQNTQAMLEKRGKELLGIALLALALAFALMLGSYSPEDPGWMVANEEPAQNLLGRFGAALSSTLIIIGGKGAWMIPVILAVWGLRFVTHRGADRAMGRIVFAVIAVAVASIFASTLVPGADWPHAFGLGGLFGDTILGALLGMAPVSAGIGLNLFSMLLGLLLAVMGFWVTGFTIVELGGLARFLLNGAIFAYDSCLVMMGKGTAQAAQAMEARRTARAEAATQRDAQRSQDWQPEAMAPAAAPAAAARGGARVQRAPDASDAPTTWGRPAALAGPLRADPRYPEPMAEAAHYAPPRERAGLLSRMPQLMRRVADPVPEPELVEPATLTHFDAEPPSDDRIKARISDAIRNRVRQPIATSNPITAAVQARREPPVARNAQRSLTQRLRGPQPLIANTRRATPAIAPDGLPAEPPLTSAHVPPQPAARSPLPPPPPLPTETAQPWPDHGNLFAPSDDIDHDALFETPLDAYEADADWLRDTAPAPQQDFDTDFDTDFDSDADLHPAPPAPPLAAPSAPLRVAPVIESRKGVVQHAPKKPLTPSRQAVSEAQPRLRFEDQVSQDYELPPLSLLASPSTIIRHQLSDEALEENARMLESVLDDYGVKGEIVSVRPGPVVTMYELEPAPGLKASRVIGLADDIARSMSALSARVSTVPGRSVIGIELPNATREKVVLREILAARDFGDSNMRLPLALGKDIGGDAIVANLAKMPHLLIAGTTGSGKSVAINTMILSLLYKLTPEECRLIMIDPKMLELSVYDGIPHLLSPVVTDPKKAVVALKWVVGEMEERYRKMSKMGVRNIEGYNGRVREALAKGELFKRTIQTGFDEDTGEPVFETEEFAPQVFPYIVVIVDEMADLMMVAGKEIEACIQRLAQMARASGIHLIMATQRPSVDVITGTIKANFPTRISFQVTSKIDSRTILGEQGAEQLLGMGDMLYMGNGAKITRIHGPFVSDEEVEEIVNHLKSFGPPKYMSGVVEGPDEDSASDIDMVLGLGGGDGEDALYDQAVAIVAKDRKCSTSYIQRKLGIGYNKAARLVEQMEEQGVVTSANHVGKREILIPEA
ncbi:DNA translocase FtsK [Pseudotabrizicola sp. L79]|uniref:DNA translocase FtsK n=1 Tax=Pseudotabrizicola sp. L79 TaxID=3118402 RepID=UPI002F942935